MSWLAQVRHVFVKDVLDARWLLLVHVAVVAMATAVASEWISDASYGFIDASTFVSLAGAFVVASAVLADSPTRADAFWATHPLRPSAVLGAKLAFALLVIVIGVIGQAIAVGTFAVRGAALWMPVMRGASHFAMYLLAAMLAAALVKDLRSFTIAVVAIPVLLTVLRGLAWAIVGTVDAPTQTSGEPRLEIPLHYLWAIIGVGLLARLYRRRDMKLPARIGGFTAAALILLTAGARFTFAGNRQPFDLPAAPYTIELRGDMLREQGFDLVMFVGDVSAAVGQRVALRATEAEVRLRDGRVLRLPVDQDLTILHGTTPLPRDLELRWLGIDTVGRRGYTNVNAKMTSEQRRALATGIESIALDGQVIVVEAERVGTLPLVAGAETSDRGFKARMISWSSEFAEPRVRLSYGTISAADEDDSIPGLWLLGADMHAALVNRRRGEALMLDSKGSSGGGSSLVLPGFYVTRRNVEFGVTWDERRPARIDQAWLADAELLILDGVIRSIYSVRIEAPVERDAR